MKFKYIVSIIFKNVILYLGNLWLVHIVFSKRHLDKKT